MLTTTCRCRAGRRRLPVRLFAFLLLAVLGGLSVGPSPAARRQTSRRRDPEDPRQGQARRQGGAAAPAGRGPGRVPAARRPGPLAENETHLDVRKLFGNSRRAEDILVYRTTGVISRVGADRSLPRPRQAGDGPAGKTEIPRLARGKDEGPEEVTKKLPVRLPAIDYYESRAVTDVARYLKQTYNKAPEGSKNHRKRLLMLQDAEKVMNAVLNFHRAARTSGQRAGGGWENVEKEVRDKLLEVKLGQVKAEEAAGHGQEAEELAERLVKADPGGPEARACYRTCASAGPSRPWRRNSSPTPGGWWNGSNSSSPT